MKNVVCKAIFLSFITILCAFRGYTNFPSAEASGKITYRLKWLFNASVVGDLYSDSQGMFKQAGLDVTVKSGGPERDAIKELELGHAQFGVASADQVIRALSKGAPVVVIAQFFQVNPLQWIYRGSMPKISRLDDLKGLTIGITYGGNDETIMRTLLAMAKLDESQYNLFSVRYDYTPFYQRRVHIWPVYRNTQGIFLNRKLAAEGETVKFFNPAQYGIKFVANSLVTSEKILNHRSVMVKKFHTALLKGWKAAIDPSNRETSLTILSHFDQESTRDILRRQLDITRSLIKPSADFAVGKIDVAAWQQTEKIMLEQGVISKPVNVARALRTPVIIK